MMYLRGRQARPEKTWPASAGAVGGGLGPAATIRLRERWASTGLPKRTLAGRQTEFLRRTCTYRFACAPQRWLGLDGPGGEEAQIVPVLRPRISLDPLR